MPIIAALIVWGAQIVQAQLPIPSPTTSPTPPRFCDFNYTQFVSDYQANLEVWSDPQCYDYLWTPIGNFPPPDDPSDGPPYLVQVRDGVVVAPPNLTVPLPVSTMADLFNLIESNCLDCPDSGAADCIAQYGDVRGEIVSLFIDVSRLVADEEVIRRIDNFTLCADDTPTTAPPRLQACPDDWQETASQINNSLAIWANPACYDFAWTRECRCLDEFRGPFAVQVRNGQVVSPKNDLVLSMNGLLTQVQAYCVEGCPEQGAAACDLVFGDSGELVSVYIDVNAATADEEIVYRVENFTVCDDAELVPSQSPVAEPLPTQRCDDNWQATAEAYRANLEFWQSPSCYRFKFERACECLPDMAGPFAVEVRNGTMVKSVEAPVPIPTIDEMLATIERECVATCPDSGAASCRIVYGDKGEVSSLYIDLEADVADEELIYFVRAFELCDQQNSVALRLRHLFALALTLITVAFL